MLVNTVYNMTFSQRQGLEPINDVVQLNSMSDALKNRLWNLLTVHFWEPIRSWGDWTVRGITESSKEKRTRKIIRLLGSLYHDYYKVALDSLLDSKLNNVIDYIRDYFFSCSYNKVYDFIEFIVNTSEIKENNAEFCDECNKVLESELSGYRFITGIVSPITSDTEIKTVTAAIDNKGSLEPASQHIVEALRKLSDKSNPDYRNSIKESISAVEATCRVITKNSKATLGDALKLIGSKLEIHAALQQSFDKAYGYTSDADGIRHALMEKDTLDFEDAYYMLISCSAFINYLKAKAYKAGIFQ